MIAVKGSWNLQIIAINVQLEFIFLYTIFKKLSKMKLFRFLVVNSRSPNEFGIMSYFISNNNNPILYMIKQFFREKIF